MISSVFDLAPSDFKEPSVCIELNLFLNDHCRSVFDGTTTLTEESKILFDLCSKLGFLTARNTWRGGQFDEYTLKLLFTHDDFAYLLDLFELWQYSNRLDDLAHTCR